MGGRGEGFAPVTDACDHQASAWAFDGDHVVIADPVGALSRGALQSLREPPEP